MINWVSSSSKDHFEIYRNWIKDLFEPLLFHSAILEETDTLDLFIWSISQNDSDFGNLSNNL